MNYLFSNTGSGDRSMSVYAAARVISYLANPLFIPPLILTAVGELRYIVFEELRWMTALALLFYTVIPLMITFYLLKTGHIKSLDLPRKKARNALFIYSVISSCLGSILLGVYCYLHHPFLTMIAIIFFLNPLAGYFINLRWKISMHTASIASGGVIFFALFYLSAQFYTSTAGIFSLVMLLILLPLMIWARYHLNIHSVSELLGGACAGIILTLLEFGLMIRFW